MASLAETPAGSVADVPAFTTTQHTFPAPDGSTVTISLRQVEKKTYYGEDIKLTGHSIWFGGLNMVSFLSTLPSLSGKSVLELGSGTGIAGISLAYKQLLHPSSSTSPPAPPPTFLLTDGEETVVSTLRSNCSLNGLSPPSVTCQQLWWGSCPALSSLLASYPSRFDVVVGADLLYSKKQCDVALKLFETVGAVLNPDGGVFYLAFTRRDMPLEFVLEAAKKHGLKAEVEEDYCYDIFDNNTDGQTEMWRDAIFKFTIDTAAQEP